MPIRLLVNGLEVASTAEDYRTVTEGIILQGQEVWLQPPYPGVRNYIHGWQSWSLTTWLEPGRPLPKPFPVATNPMRIDPALADHPYAHSAWVGALEFAEGGVLLLGALGLGAHVDYQQDGMRGWYDDATGEWLVAYGTEQQVFAAYTAVLARLLGGRRDLPAPRVWCSWYSYYAHPDQASLALDLQGLRGLPLDVFQVDDGWQRAVGDWQPNKRFSDGMLALARIIRAEKLTPGLWLAPLIASRSSQLFAEHPDWFLRNDRGRLVSAGYNWGRPLYALDPSQDAVTEWLTALMRTVRGWGYDYVKLDFLYAGALPGNRTGGAAREPALRAALEVMREGLGDAYLLTCGVPILPALSLCDGMRIGPDVGASWYDTLASETLHDFGMPGGRNALRTSLHRLWLKPLVHTDPDVAFFRSFHTHWTSEQRRLFQALAMIAGFRGTSDLPRWLEEPERARLDAFLRAQPVVRQLERYRYVLDEDKVDFSAHVELPPEAAMRAGLCKRLVQRASNSGAVMSLAQTYDDYRQRRELRKQSRLDRR